MDFIKLFDLCRTGRLYFPSAQSLREQDPFEGSYTLYHSKYQLFGTAGGPEIRSWMTERHVTPADVDEKTWRFLQEVDLNIRRNIGRYMFVNSWHMADDESLAMWKLYSPSGYGIAIVSDFTRLSDSIGQNQEDIYIGMVTYVDYETEDEWLGNYFDPFMHKHRAFMHEKEARAVVWSKGFEAYWANAHKEIAAKYDLPPPRPRKFNGDEDPDGDEIDDSDLNPAAGISLPCDLDRLVDHIVVSPDSQAWMVDAIADYCDSAVGKKVVLSKLKSGPFF